MTHKGLWVGFEFWGGVWWFRYVVRKHTYYNLKTNKAVDINELKDGIVSILFSLLYFRMK